jgi:Tfp pilus assembly protein PilP
VWDVAEPIAMFKAPNGRRYILKSGDKIARNNGFIVSIEHGEVNIKETIVDLAGKRSERTTIKTVKKELVGGGLNERTS